MILLPSLTSTKKNRISSFIQDLKKSKQRHIALFPTCLNYAERKVIYMELEAIDGLCIPHVHLRSDFTIEEMQYLQAQFKTELFNIHPNTSSHPFGPIPEQFAPCVFIENTEIPAQDSELIKAGMCIDFSHLENADRLANSNYVNTVIHQAENFNIGCCHISAIRETQNSWKGGFDYHEYSEINELQYIFKYKKYLPKTWASLELENNLDEQMAAIDFITNGLSK